MNYKRKGAKSIRAGCLLCKPWKVMGNSKQALKHQDCKATEKFKVELLFL